MTNTARKPLTSYTALILGRPIAWARTVTGDNGGRYTPTRYRRWKTDATEVAEASGRFRAFEPDAEIAITITVHPDGIKVDAAALDGDDHRRPKGITGDLDNYVKAVLDTLQSAGVLTDDRQAVHLVAGFNPHPINPDRKAHR